MATDTLVFSLPLAFVLDFLLGDPLWLPHPVRMMGAAVHKLEPIYRRLPLHTAASGALFAATLVTATWAVGALLLSGADRLLPGLRIVPETVILYTCLSVRSLKEAVLKVHAALKDDGLDAGKAAVAMVVGRDVRPLNETGVARAAVETVAENLVDGILSPLFFAVIGGAPLCLAFKMISTLDSMVGYKNERYIAFGKAAARLDDVANFIPARLSVPVIAVAAKLLTGVGMCAFKTAVAQGRRHASPNAGYPEAAFAGALGLRLGGPNIYHGRKIEKPYIGEGFGDVSPGDIPNACALMVASSLVGFMLSWGIAALCG